MSNKNFKPETLAAVDRLCPMDDTFFRLLAEDKDFCQEVIQVILNMPDLKVVKAEPQKVLHNINGRSVTVDVLCENAMGELFNIEIQKEDNDDHVKRVRYNAANIDIAMSRKGTDFKELKDIYIIYISKFDVFSLGRTMCHVDKVIRETGDILNDGIHMVYVNTKVNDGTAVAELMEIFKSSSAEENEKFPNVCRAVRNFKVGKGRDTMCAVVEEYAKEYAEKYAAEKTKKTIKGLISAGATDELIKKATGYTQEQIDELRSEME